MFINERKLSDDSFNSIIVNKCDLDKLYPLIGCGVEGCVYNYRDIYALKHLSLFRILERYYNINIGRKFQKIVEMSHLSDDNFCFPIGLLGFEDLFMEGYYMRLVKCSNNFHDFSALGSLNDKSKVIDYLVDADLAIKKAHSLGLRIGDIREENILIGDDGKAYFTDTDNYVYQDFDFDLFPSRASTMRRIYGGDFDLADNDRFVYTLMALKILTGINIFLSRQIDDTLLSELIKQLDFDKETKEGLRLILSDSSNKPYFSDVYVKKK